MGVNKVTPFSSSPISSKRSEGSVHSSAGSFWLEGEDGETETKEADPGFFVYWIQVYALGLVCLGTSLSYIFVLESVRTTLVTYTSGSTLKYSFENFTMQGDSGILYAHCYNWKDNFKGFDLYFCDYFLSQNYVVHLIFFVGATKSRNEKKKDVQPLVYYRLIFGNIVWILSFFIFQRNNTEILSSPILFVLFLVISNGLGNFISAFGRALGKNRNRKCKKALSYFVSSFVGPVMDFLFPLCIIGTFSIRNELLQVFAYGFVVPVMQFILRKYMLNTMTNATKYRVLTLKRKREMLQLGEYGLDQNWNVCFQVSWFFIQNIPVFVATVITSKIIETSIQFLLVLYYRSSYEKKRFLSLVYAARENSEINSLLFVFGVMMIYFYNEFLAGKFLCTAIVILVISSLFKKLGESHDFNIRCDAIHKNISKVRIVCTTMIVTYYTLIYVIMSISLPCYFN